MYSEISGMAFGVFAAAILILRIVKLVNGESLKSIIQWRPGEQPAGLLMATVMVVLFALDQQDLTKRNAAVSAAVAVGIATALVIARDLRKWFVKRSVARRSRDVAFIRSTVQGNGRPVTERPEYFQ
jgi:hypothetical protein